MEQAMESLRAVDGRNCRSLVGKARFRILSTFVTAAIATRRESPTAVSTVLVLLFSSARGGLESGLELRIREKRLAHIFNCRPLCYTITV